MSRVYLDWNATTPVRTEARDAMIAAMDVVGNPSSVHREGRAATAIVEKARGQIRAAFGAENADLVFTSSATEAAALAMAGRDMAASDVEHDCVSAWSDGDLVTDANGIVAIKDPEMSAVQMANSETGILQDLPNGVGVVDAVQAFCKVSCAFEWSGAQMAMLSAHKLGGPKGVGALILRQGIDLKAQIKGGGQEMGRRSGTENVIGIAGFGAAAEAGARDLANGVWEEVAQLRDKMEAMIADAVPDVVLVGQSVKRLPNTSCFAVPNWRGETQVMQMDLAGFAISAGSACSSGKVKASKVLKAMGYDDITAASAVRVSLGPTTTEQEVTDFAQAWIKAYRKFAAKAA
ncbi:aminotransferase [Amylibacter kogurei]|uniref:Cysteine desulfurase n=1 Tax=Paramylibacter kogurei TaxID=1889778 RepID=A0A2G5K584_9RHOB|nr:aminotransferase class V-fold PLP-dependent enzyme [Amylibacter kogurei]PIB24686.1 aminotransferase [Amylibacter kogurei]